MRHLDVTNPVYVTQMSRTQWLVESFHEPNKSFTNDHRLDTSSTLHEPSESDRCHELSQVDVTNWVISNITTSVGDVIYVEYVNSVGHVTNSMSHPNVTNPMIRWVLSQRLIGFLIHLVTSIGLNQYRFNCRHGSRTEYTFNCIHYTKSRTSLTQWLSPLDKMTCHELIQSSGCLQVNESSMRPSESFNCIHYKNITNWFSRLVHLVTSRRLNQTRSLGDIQTTESVRDIFVVYAVEWFTWTHRWHVNHSTAYAFRWTHVQLHTLQKYHELIQSSGCHQVNESSTSHELNESPTCHELIQPSGCHQMKESSMYPNEPYTRQKGFRV